MRTSSASIRGPYAKARAVFAMVSLAMADIISSIPRRPSPTASVARARTASRAGESLTLASQHSDTTLARSTLRSAGLSRLHLPSTVHRPRTRTRSRTYTLAKGQRARATIGGLEERPVLIRLWRLLCAMRWTPRVRVGTLHLSVVGTM